MVQEYTCTKIESSTDDCSLMNVARRRYSRRLNEPFWKVYRLLRETDKVPPPPPYAPTKAQLKTHINPKSAYCEAIFLNRTCILETPCESKREIMI